MKLQQTQRLSLGVDRKNRTLDLFGQQLLVVLRFIQSNFDLAGSFDDVVTAEKAVSAKELFINEGKQWILRPDSLPGDLALKAVAFSRRTLFLELAPLDLGEVQKMIAEEMLPISLDEMYVRNATTRKILARVGSTEHPKHEDIELAPRCLWSIRISSLNEAEKHAIVDFLDRIYSAGVFSREGIEDEEEELVSVSDHRKPKIELRLSLRLQLRLAMEQRAMLSRVQRPEGRLELQQIFALQNTILHMDEEQLVEFIVNSNETRGNGATSSILLFVATGRVKTAKPSLSWKQARQIAKRLAKKPIE